MTVATHPSTEHGFALVLTLSLIALMVMALYALSVLVHVNGNISTATGYQLQANQHARLGLAQAVGALQKLAGPDDRVTAMAGIGGAEGGSELRHWCGVWTSGGEFLGWLTSGASAAAIPSCVATRRIQVVERKSVGTKPATLSAYVDEEYVDAGLIDVVGPSRQGAPTTTFGGYAYWVGDEGVKVSAFAPIGQLPSGGIVIGIASTPVNVARIGTAYQEYDVTNAARILCYEQAINLFYASGSKLTASNLHDSFHHVTVTHRALSAAGDLEVGRVNLNTTSAVVWRSLIEAYESAPGATPFATASKRTLAINTIAQDIAASGSGKAPYGPYTSVSAFLTGELLQTAITGTNGITVAEFSAAISPMLAVRSDTFRIRSYGEAVNVLDSTKIEATAYCEALVQRTATVAPNALGRAFVVTYFRWLGPDDI